MRISARHNVTNVQVSTPAPDRLGARLADVVNKSILVAVVSLLALNAILFIAAAWTLTRFPYELDYGEGIVLWQTDRVIHLAEAYHPIVQYPFIVFHYPPVYHLASRAARTVFHDPLVSGRMVTWLSALGVAVLVALITRMGIQTTRARVLGATITSLLVFQLPNIDWVPYMRVDMTAIFFSLLGIFIFLRFPNRWGYVATAVMFVIAIFTKQTMVAAPAAAVLILLSTKQVREAVLMTTLCAVLGLAVLAFLSLATHGQFLVHVIRYNVNPFNFRQLFTFTQANFSGLNGLGALAWALPIVLLNRRRNSLEKVTRNSPSTVRMTMIVYFVGAFMLTVMAGKTGAYKNYFLEWNIVSCILVGFIVGGTLSTRWYRSVTATAMILIIGALAVGRIHGQGSGTIRNLHIVQDRDDTLLRFRIEDERVLDLVRQTPDPVLSDNLTFLMLADKDIPWEPAIVTQLANAGIWDETPAIEMIRNRRFRLVVLKYLDEPIFHTAAVQETVRQNYVDSGQSTARYKILVPK